MEGDVLNLIGRLIVATKRVGCQVAHSGGILGVKLDFETGIGIVFSRHCMIDFRRVGWVEIRSLTPPLHTSTRLANAKCKFNWKLSSIILMRTQHAKQLTFRWKSPRIDTDVNASIRFIILIWGVAHTNRPRDSLNRIWTSAHGWNENRNPAAGRASRRKCARVESIKWNANWSLTLKYSNSAAAVADAAFAFRLRR